MDKNSLEIREAYEKIEKELAALEDLHAKEEWPTPRWRKEKKEVIEKIRDIIKKEKG